MKIENRTAKRTIWLDGPDGNVWSLLGYAKSLCLQIDRTGALCHKFEKEAKTEGTYAGIVKTFDKYFKDVVELQMSEEYAKGQGITP